MEKHQVITIDFTLADAEGNLIETTEGNVPFSFLTGTEEILPKLEEEILAMKIGDGKKIVLTPDEAYGDYDPEKIHMMDISDFPEDVKVEIGMEFMTTLEDGSDAVFMVTDIENDEVTIDFNEPLSGHTLHFDIMVLAKRLATEEEIAHGHVHDDHHHH